MGRRHGPSLTPRLILDTGALIGLERADARAYEHVATAARRGFQIVVPTLVVMEALASARSPDRLNQILRRIDAELPLTPEIAHQVPALKRRAGVTSDADAVVVLEALAVPGSIILTSDSGDIHALLDAAGAHGHVPVLRV
jgi:predicted nucleic acid-binding protein